MKLLKQINPRLYLLLYLCTINMVLSISTFSGIIFYTDFSSFDANTTTVLIEDFEAVTPKNTSLPSFGHNGNVYTGFAGVPFPNVYVSAPGFTNFGVPVTSSSVLTANGDEDFSIDFGTPSTAIGFNTYLNRFGPATVNIFGSSGLIDTFLLSHDPLQIGFLGITSTEAVTSIRWTTSGGALINTGIDNIRQGSMENAPAVPEPATAILLVIGLVVLGMRGVRFRGMGS